MDQIEQAVKYALDPSADANLRRQAYEFCNQLRDSPEGWRHCLELYQREPKADPTTRHFALQVIEHVLQNADRLLEPAHLLTIREALFACVTRDYRTSTTTAAEPAYVRNKLAHTVALLFLTTYSQHWPLFFADLHGLMYGPVSPGNASSLGDKALHPGITDFYLRILLAIDEEMVNPVIHRGAAEVERNTRIKDTMRERDLTNLAATWHDILVYFQNQPLDIVPMLLRILGVYVSWIDISLVANDRFIPLIYQCLESRAAPNANATPVRNAACDCLTEIVRKGMKPPDKLALIQYLGVPNVVVRLDVASFDNTQEQDTEFTEHVARLINVTGLELKMVWLETDAAADAHQNAQRLMEQLFPAALYLLADEYDEISTAIFPFLNEMLTLFKKQVRRNQTLSETQQQFIRALAPILLLKMKYDEDSDWDPLDDDEAEALFQEMRKSIQGYLQNLAIIDSSMFMSLLAGITEKVYGNARQFGFTAQDASPAAATISQPNSYLSGVRSGNLVLSLSDALQSLTVLAAKTLETLQNVVRDGPVSWSQAELGLCLTHLWTVAFPHRGPLAYTTTGGPMSLDAPAEHWTAIGQLLRLMIQSNVVAVNHPLVSLSYFETVVRYYTFFDACPNAVPLVLEAFVDQRGLHHSADRVRYRTYYTFHRFVKLLKKVDIGPYVQTVLNALQDLLGVQAQAPTMNSTGSADDLATDKAFDSQVYLFETAGSLATYPSLDANVKGQYLKAVLDPLLSQAQTLVQAGTLAATSDDYSVWQLHHLLMAIGSVAKGVPEAPKQGPMPWTAQLTQATEITLLGLNAGGRFPIVRDASRFAFARLSTCLGLDSLQFLPVLIQRLLADCSMPEFTDFLGFMDLIMYKFKPTIISTLNELVLPLAEKVFAFLDSKPLGTDDAIQQVDLKKGYLNFLATIIYTDMSSVLLTDTNKPQLMGLLQSILPLATTPDQPEVQKMAFNLLGRLAQAWLGQYQPTSDSSPGNPKPSSKPGQPVPIARHPVVPIAPSDQEALLQFYYERVVPLCFEVAMKPTITLADSANVLVFYELAYLLQVLQVRADPQFSEYVATRVLPSIQCPPNMCTEFAQALQSLDIKEFRKYFQRFVGK